MGGVSPLGLPRPLRIYCDASLKDFDEVLPAAELLYERGLGPLRGHWSELEQRLALTAPTSGIGDWNSAYTRFVALDDIAKAKPGSIATPATLPRTAIAHDDIEVRVLHDNRLGRLRALDRLGIDVQLLHPGPDIDVVMELDRAESTLLLNAYNSYVTTFCEADPQRLKAVLQLNAGETEWSAQELIAFAGHPSAAGVTLHFPRDAGPDSLDMTQLWDALARTGLPLIHRPTLFACDPPRLVEHLLRSEVLARWPALRLAFVGWPQEEWAGWAGALWPKHAAGSASRTSSVPLAERIAFAVETLRVEDQGGASVRDVPIEALLWASHFPFETATSAGQILSARNGDPLACAALIDNPRRLLARRTNVALAAVAAE